jgi:outer membrane lipoprotein-sorting protein
MIRRLTILLLACCLAYYAAAQTPVADRDAVLTRIEAALTPQAGKTIKYTFTQTKHSPLLAQDAISHGNVTLTGDRFLRWHYTDPRDHAFIIDGDSIFAETNGKSHSLAGPAGSIMRNMTSTMMSLTSAGTLSSEKVFSVELTEDASAYHATLIPKRRDMKRMMQQLLVDFDKKSCRVLKVKLIEKHNSFTVIEFRAK